MLMAHNWPWVSVMGTNVKTTFLELFLWRVKITKKNIATIFLNMTRSTNIIMHSFSKIITVRGYAFLIKTRTICITKHGFAFSYISRIQVSISRFRNKCGFWSKPVLRTYQQLKSKHTYIIIECHNFCKWSN